MTKRLTFFSRTAPLIAIAVAAFPQTQHITAYTGTWTLNLAKSEYQHGMRPPASGTLRFMEDGKTIISWTDESGQTSEISFPWSGGKDVPVALKGLPSTMKNVTFRQDIRGRIADAELKEDGKTRMKVQATVSPDGNTQIGNITRIDENGNRMQHVEFYEKQ